MRSIDMKASAKAKTPQKSTTMKLSMSKIDSLIMRKSQLNVVRVRR